MAFVHLKTRGIFSPKGAKFWSIRLVSNDDDSVLDMNHDSDRFETDVSACWSNRETEWTIKVNGRQ